MDPVSPSRLFQPRPAPQVSAGIAPVAASDRREGGVAGPDFADMLGEAITGAVRQMRKAEAVSLAGIRGTAPTQEVVEQVMAAEQALQASIAVRDKIVAAYLEISRMQV